MMESSGGGIATDAHISERMWLKKKNDFSTMNLSFDEVCFQCSGGLIVRSSSIATNRRMTDEDADDCVAAVRGG